MTFCSYYQYPSTGVEVKKQSCFKHVSIPLALP